MAKHCWFTRQTADADERPFWFSKNRAVKIIEFESNRADNNVVKRVPLYFLFLYLAFPLPAVLGQLGGNVCLNPSPRARDTGLSLASFAKNPLFLKDGPSKDDVFQGDGGDCYFLSMLA